MAERPPALGDATLDALNEFAIDCFGEFLLADDSGLWPSNVWVNAFAEDERDPALAHPRPHEPANDRADLQPPRPDRCLRGGAPDGGEPLGPSVTAAAGHIRRLGSGLDRDG